MAREFPRWNAVREAAGPKSRRSGLLAAP